MNTFKLEIVTSDEGHPLRDIVSIDVPAEDGRLTVLARHQPFVCSLTSGEIKIVPETGGKESWHIEPGTMSVTADGVMLLVKSFRPHIA